MHVTAGNLQISILLFALSLQLIAICVNLFFQNMKHSFYILFLSAGNLVRLYTVHVHHFTTALITPTYIHTYIQYIFTSNMQINLPASLPNVLW